MNTTTLTLELCRHLHTLGAGIFNETTPYAPTDHAITIKHLPTSPDHALAVAVYGVEDPVPGLVDVTVQVQLRFRAPGPVLAVDEWADRVHGLLQYRHGVVMGDLRVSRVRRLSVAPLGQDANRREERADNYELIVRLP